MAEHLRDKCSPTENRHRIAHIRALRDSRRQNSFLKRDHSPRYPFSEDKEVAATSKMKRAFFISAFPLSLPGKSGLGLNAREEFADVWVRHSTCKEPRGFL